MVTDHDRQRKGLERVEPSVETHNYWTLIKCSKSTSKFANTVVTDPIINCMWKNKILLLFYVFFCFFVLARETMFMIQTIPFWSQEWGPHKNVLLDFTTSFKDTI